MPRVVVDQDHFAGFGRKKHGLRDADALAYVGGHDASERCGEPFRVASRDDLDTTSIERRVVERSPDLERGLAIEAPELSSVLVPRKIAAASLGRLVEDARAIDDRC
jgi:hypothetical protein